VASAMRTHGTQSGSMFMCRFETRAFEIYATLPAVQGRYLPDDTVQFVSLTHIVANAELENNNYRMIS